VESAELLECFQWNENFKLEKVKEELADVIVNCQNLADELNLDLDEVINEKMDQNEKKVPS
jgi:NTP pyrophosphatase (non-canonical NTP hydrolase)